MKYRKKRCRNCGNYFLPDIYNYDRQKYCKEDDCRKASNRASSKTHRKKSSKVPAFRRCESERVQIWQHKNPDYWKDRKKSCKKISKKPILRDFAQVEKLQSDMTVLRDFANSQYLVIEGLINHLTGDVLRDDIRDFIRKLYDKGRNISGSLPEEEIFIQFKKERSSDVKKASDRLSAEKSNSQAFQLGRSQSCEKRLL